MVGQSQGKKRNAPRNYWSDLAHRIYGQREFIGKVTLIVGTFAAEALSTYSLLRYAFHKSALDAFGGTWVMMLLLYSIQVVLLIDYHYWREENQ